MQGTEGVRRGDRKTTGELILLRPTLNTTHVTLGWACIFSRTDSERDLVVTSIERVLDIKILLVSVDR